MLPAEINSFISKHPDFVIFISIMILLFIIIIRKNAHNNLKIDSMIKGMNIIFNNQGLEDLIADVSFLNGVNQTALISPGLKVELLDDMIDKGYDFFVSEYEGNLEEVVPMHRHSRTAEYFYIIQGELSIETNSKLYVLTSGTSLYLPPKQPHKLIMKEYCKFITIAKPPIFSRIGKFYEKVERLFKKD